VHPSNLQAIIHNIL